MGDSKIQIFQNRGSTWHRWEPHIHAPGTLFNDQFKGNWTGYLEAVEKSEPTIRALAVTDYYLTDTYEHVLNHKSQGRLESVDLIYPNIELRLEVGTVKGRRLNLHLLICPDDDDHIEQTNRFLEKLYFTVSGEKFNCTRDGLTRLGKAVHSEIIEDVAALKYGAEQFKVNFNNLRDEYEGSEWAKKNILVAVAGSVTDGTSGMRDGADATLRKEIEAFAHIIFASSPAQRNFWLGRGVSNKEELYSAYGGLKPCLHGSDAHDNGSVGEPYGNRYSWIKGGLEFDTLRQACIDPEGRAFVGEKPPSSGTPSQQIDEVEISDADWMETSKIALNPGLVAIIGARGSGKTALADMIAMGCDAIEQQQAEVTKPSSSFLSRAKELLGSSQIKINWRVGDSSERALDGSKTQEVTYPRARYLSQQFVEELCSSDSLNDGLLEEIERVIYEAHPLLEKSGTLNFTALLKKRSERYRQARQREESAISQLSERIGDELEKARQLNDLRKALEKKKKQIAAYHKDLSSFVTKGSEERMARLKEVMEASDTVLKRIRIFGDQEQSLLAMQDEVKALRDNEAPEMLRESQERHVASKLKDEDWKAFKIDYTGDVDGQLKSYLKECRDTLKSLRGLELNQPEDINEALIKPDQNLNELPLGLLKAETTRLQNLIDVDDNTKKSFKALSDKISNETAALETLESQLKYAEGATERAASLQKDREDTYQRVFDAIISEQQVLIDLYAPMEQRLSSSKGTLKKMSFHVTRRIDLTKWAMQAEENLLDLRRQGPFKGQGALEKIAEDSLLDAWREGDSQSVKEAIGKFFKDNKDDLFAHSTVSRTDKDYRSWLKRFAKWLYSTDHITLEYGIEYDGVDIRKLSPGTRGIVLLLLYLALDDEDDRPLIIDQPEENLDPKSVYDELVELFIEAKTKRQVIMVTHNANLVINTDADQIIVAEASAHTPGKLPKFTYTSGGLENKKIRELVCSILEGGEIAFKERARRLRVRLNR